MLFLTYQLFYSLEISSATHLHSPAKDCRLHIASTSKQRITYHPTTVTRKSIRVKSNELEYKTYGCKTQVYSTHVERQCKSDEWRKKREIWMKFQG